MKGNQNKETLQNKQAHANCHYGNLCKEINHQRFSNKLSFSPKYKHIINLDHSNPDQNELSTQDKCLCAVNVSHWVQFAPVLIDVVFLCPRSFICDLACDFLFL